MRSRILVILLILVAASSWAFDFGGYLDNVTGIASPPVGVTSPVVLVQDTTLALWAQQQLGTWELDGQASYTYTPAVPVLVNLDRLTLSSTVPALETGASSVGLTIGRTNFTDFTGYILNHTLDGVKLSATWARSFVTIGVATTALLQQPTSGIILSSADVLDLSNPTRAFVSPRLLASIDFRTVDALAGQQVMLGAVIQEDLRPESELTSVGTELADPTAAGAFDTQHVVLAISGALAPGLYQKVFYALNTGRTLSYLPDADSGTLSSYQYAFVLGHMAGAELTYFLPNTLNSRVRLSGLFSTGDDDADAYYDGNTAGTSTAFVPISGSGFSDVFSLQPGNSSHIGISYSLRPLATVGVDILQVEASGIAYLRTTGTGPVSEPSVNPESVGTYVGTDLNLSLTAQPFSDLRIVLAGGAFLPNAAVMSTGNEKVDYQVTLQGVLRF